MTKDVARAVLFPLLCLLAWQGLDVAAHVATGQVEPLRIIASVVLLAGVVAATRVTQRRSVLIGAVAGYLVLNLLFLASHGLFNPVTNAPRLPLFGFVGISFVLVYWVALRGGFVAQNTKKS